MSLLTNPFEKQPRVRLSELQRLVAGDRLSVRALAERRACSVAESIFPLVVLGDEMIEKINGKTSPDPISTETAGRLAVDGSTNVIPITTARHADHATHTNETNGLSSNEPTPTASGSQSNVIPVEVAKPSSADTQEDMARRAREMIEAA